MRACAQVHPATWHSSPVAVKVLKDTKNQEQEEQLRRGMPPAELLAAVYQV